jgi:hypothetical protein
MGCSYYTETNEGFLPQELSLVSYRDFSSGLNMALPTQVFCPRLNQPKSGVTGNQRFHKIRQKSTCGIYLLSLPSKEQSKTTIKVFKKTSNDCKATSLKGCSLSLYQEAVSECRLFFCCFPLRR